MAIENIVNIWQPPNGSKFRSDHTWNFWFDSIVLVDQVSNAIMLEILIIYIFACFV